MRHRWLLDIAVCGLVLGLAAPALASVSLGQRTSTLSSAGKHDTLIAKKGGSKKSKSTTSKKGKETPPADETPAPPPPPAAETPAGGADAGGGELMGSHRGPARVDFDDRLVQGQTNKSGAIYIFERKNSEIHSMVRRRTSFREEILRSIE